MLKAFLSFLFGILLALALVVVVIENIELPAIVAPDPSEIPPSCVVTHKPLRYPAGPPRP